MDYQKFVGTRIWVPEAGPADEHGHNAEICCVFPRSSTPDKLNVNAQVLGHREVIHGLDENVGFFWAKPSTERPKIKVPVTYYGTLWRRKDRQCVQVGNGGVLEDFVEKIDPPRPQDIPSDWEYLGIHEVVIMEER